MQVERIGVCGLGKVGSVIHKVFTDAGFSAVGYDSDSTKSMCSDVPTLVANTDACIFIVPTPSLPDGTFDNSHIAAAINKRLRREQRELAAKHGPSWRVGHTDLDGI